MRKKALLLLAAVVLASCSWPDSSVYYTFNEKSGEVMLTDLYGLVFKPVCSVDGKEKKCGAVFREFMEESMVFTSHMEYSTTEIVIPGFKDASILSLQVKDENSGDVRPLLSYKQSDIPYMKGSTYVPSVMELHAASAPTEYTLSGYYDGDEWVNRDTTVSVGDTLFANEDGLLRFTVQDKAGNKASLEVDLGNVLKKNDASTIKSQQVKGYDWETRKDTSYTYYYWVADAGTVSFKSLETNFEPLKSSPTSTVPFLHLLFAENRSYTSGDSNLVDGGFNKSALWITVVNYAK